ncbi:MAG: DUF1579 domain-containing protein [Planctomycetota bacterium]
MKNSRFLTLFAVAAVAAGSTYALTSQDKGKEAKPASAPSDDAFMAKMMEYGTPGAEHKLLEARAGKWTDKYSMWMSPDSEPMTSTGTSEYKVMYGGRYLHGAVKGDFMGEPFEGLCAMGFDNMKKKYFSTWLDNMSTGMMMYEGTYDAATKTFTFTGECPDFVSGKYQPSKSTEKMTDANTYVAEMWSTDTKTGKMFKSMEITSTRAK